MGELVKSREQDIGEGYGQQKRDGRNQQRLGQELVNQMVLECAVGLANTNFLCSVGRPRRGQIHVVDTGNEQDEQGYDSEDINVPQCPLIHRFYVVVSGPVHNTFGAQVHIGQRLQAVTRRRSRFPLHVGVEQIRNLPGRYCWVGIIFQQEKSQEILGIPIRGHLRKLIIGADGRF